MKKFAIIGILSISILLSGCAKNTLNTNEKQEETILTYENKEEKFSLKFPSAWTFQENAYGSNVMFFAPEDDNKIKENLGITVQKLGSGDDLNNIYTNNKTMLESNFENFSVKEEEDMSIGKLSGKKIIYTFSQGEYKIKQAQYITIYDKKLYTFTYVAINNSFDKYEKTVEEIIESFTTK